MLVIIIKNNNYYLLLNNYDFIQINDSKIYNQVCLIYCKKKLYKGPLYILLIIIVQVWKWMGFLCPVKIFLKQPVNSVG